MFVDDRLMQSFISSNHPSVGANAFLAGAISYVRYIKLLFSVCFVVRIRVRVSVFCSIPDSCSTSFARCRVLHVLLLDHPGVHHG